MNVDRLKALRARDQPPTLIAGVSDYCDGWCDRCRLRWRCAVHQGQRRYFAAMREGDEAFARHMDNLVNADEWDHPLPPQLADEWAELRTDIEGSQPSTVEQLDRFFARLDRHRSRTEAHPLARSASEYADLAVGVLDGLAPSFDRQAGPTRQMPEPTFSALESIGQHAPTIAVKTRRAVGHLVPGHPAGDSPEVDPRRSSTIVQSDANGCAKLVRLLIGQSQEAWQCVMDAPEPIANGVPAAMLVRLGALDGQIARAFPRAMAFLRSGFDDVPMPL